METSLFTFWWDNVERADYNPNDWFGESTLKPLHDNFNVAFTRTFPKLLYTNPFTAYTNANLWTGSRITGTAETNWNEQQTRAALLAGLRAVGFVGDESNFHLSMKTIQQIQNGEQLTLPETTVNPLATTDGADKAVKKISPWFYGALVLGALVIIRRR